MRMARIVWIVVFLSLFVSSGVQGKTARERVNALRDSASCISCWPGSRSEEGCERCMATARRHRKAKEAYERRKAELDKLGRVASQLHDPFRVPGTWTSPYPSVCQTAQECSKRAEEMTADVRRARKENWIQYQRAIGKDIPKESTIVEDYFRAKGWMKEAGN